MLSRQVCMGLGRMAGSQLAASARLLSTPALRATKPASHLIRSAQVSFSLSCRSWGNGRGWMNGQALGAATSGPLVSQRSSTTVTGPMGHGMLFKIEKLFPLAMLPLFPAGWFIHGNPLIDYGLTFAIALHAHWGVHIVIEVHPQPQLSS